MDDKKTILVVDDEEDIRELLNFNLSEEGYNVLTASCGASAISAAVKNIPDLIVLDVMMDEISGIGVCRELRNRDITKKIPIIFLSAKTGEMDKILGLETGGDDYVEKPFSVRELISRIKAVIRRTAGDGVTEKSMEKISHEDMVLNLKSKKLFIDEKKINLTKREYLLLYTFLTNPGRLLSRGEILDRVWGENVYIEERVVDVYIRRLRIKLDRYSGIIVTSPGLGYGYKI